jgi:muramoyltetrapeptide carboxypeptidase
MKQTYLIAPSSNIAPDMVAKTKAYFETLGRKVILPEDTFGKDLLCANTDELRFKHLKEALLSDADEIVNIKGGYGLTRLMPQLMTLSKPTKMKLMYGISDATALHIFLNQVWDWPTVHGPAGGQLSEQRVDDVSIERTLRVMEGGLSAYVLPDLLPLNPAAKKLSSISGKVIGGNLTLVQTCIGTPWQLQASGKIYFFEDVQERGYRIDRMLCHLQQAKLFEGVKAILFGDFIKGEEPNGTDLTWEVIHRFAEDLLIPIFQLPGCGHGLQNYPIPFNYELHLKVMG